MKKYLIIFDNGISLHSKESTLCLIKPLWSSMTVLTLSSVAGNGVDVRTITAIQERAGSPTSAVTEADRLCTRSRTRARTRWDRGLSRWDRDRFQWDRDRSLWDRDRSRDPSHRPEPTTGLRLDLLLLPAWTTADIVVPIVSRCTTLLFQTRPRRAAQRLLTDFCGV